MFQPLYPTVLSVADFQIYLCPCATACGATLVGVAVKLWLSKSCIPSLPLVFHLTVSWAFKNAQMQVLRMKIKNIYNLFKFHVVSVLLEGLNSTVDFSDRSLGGSFITDSKDGSRDSE